MFDTWFGGIELTALALILTVFVLIPVQIFLCFRVKNLFIRLLPVLLLFSLILIYSLMGLAGSGWDTVGYTYLAIVTGLMLLPCGIVWGVWAVTRLYRKKH